ncbi:MAG: DUF4143 domain-containing protein [Gemmatimonadales bacterium]
MGGGSSSNATSRWLQATFLVQLIPAWLTNVGQRLVKSPKVVLTDSGLTAYLLGLDPCRLDREPGLRGGLLEVFVATELRKQIGWSSLPVELYHFRSHAGAEVDLVLEGAGGDIAGIEVKASMTVTGADFNGLRVLARDSGKRFLRGVVLYTGSEVIPFGSRLEARPVQNLWA